MNHVQSIPAVYDDILRRAEAPDWLVVDAAFASRARQCVPVEGAEIVPIDAFEARLAAGEPARHVLAAIASDEKPIIVRLAAALAAVGSAASLIDVKHQGLAAQIVRRPLVPLLESPPPSITFVILCTPRSGSTYLCQHLAAAGIGQPREHVRPELVQALRARPGFAFNLGVWFEAVQAMERVGDIFGTKIIGHLLTSAERLTTSEEQAHFASLAARSRIIYLHRPDIVMQALSQDRARETRIFHVLEEARYDEYLRQSSGWTYNFDRIARNLDQIVSQEIRLRNLLRCLREPIHEVSYDDVVADPDGEVKRIAEFIGVPSPTRTEEPGIIRLANEQSSEFAARFRAEYIARRGEPPPQPSIR